jgi:hypothetical protein
MQYEVSRLQAIVRGIIVRKNANLRLGSCIMIQAAARRFLAISKIRAMKASLAIVMASAEALRETHASKHIQFWWRVVLDCRKEKQAALVIERFFLMVKREVDREIERVARKRNSKREQRRRKKKEADEKMLERVWLNTVDENGTSAYLYSPSESGATSRSRSSVSVSSHSSRKSQKSSKQGVSHRASSPTMNLVMRHEHETGQANGRAQEADPLNLTYSAESADGSDVFSSIGSLYRQSSARKSTMSRSELSQDLSLEEAYLDTAVQQGKEKKKAAEKYLMMYGIRNSPSKPTRVHHFFADDLESTMSGDSSASSIQGVKYTLTRSPSNTPTNSERLSSPRSRLSPVNERPYPNLSRVHQSKSPRIPSPRKGESPLRSKIERNPYPYPDFLAKMEKKRTIEPEEYVGEEFGLI